MERGEAVKGSEVMEGGVAVEGGAGPRQTGGAGTS